MLILKKLKLYGWMSYKDAEIDLNVPGVTHIIGKLGSGKSAIIEAICYLLFGNSLRKGSVNDWENKILKDGYDIELEIENNGIPAKIRAARNRPPEVPAGVSFSTFKDGVEEKCRGKSDVETRKNVEEFLGMSFDEFKSISIIGQRQTQTLIEGGPSAKAKTISDLFALDCYDQAIEKCEAEYKTEKKKLETEKQGLITQQAEISALEKATPDLVDEDIYAYTNEKVSEINLKLEKYENKMAQLRKKEEAAINTVAMIAAEKRQKEKFDELDSYVEKLEIAVSNMPQPRRTAQEINNDIKLCTEGKVAAGYELNRLEQQSKQATRTDMYCPISKKPCPTNVPNTYKNEILAECGEKIREETQKKEEYVARLHTVTKEKEAYEEYTREKARLDNARDQLSKIHPTFTQNEEQENETLHKVRESLSKGKEYIRDAQRELADFRAKLAGMDERRRTLEKYLSEVLGKKMVYEREKERVRALEDEFRYLETSLEILKKIRLAKIELVIDLLNKNLNKTLQEISGNTLSAMFTTSKLDARGKKLLDKIELSAYDSYKEMPICMWSGGQLTQISLAVLLSVFQVARELSGKATTCLWLDEPFEFLDENLDPIIEEIVNIAHKYGTAIKMMSHRSINEEIMDHIWDIQNVDGVSSINVRF